VCVCIYPLCCSSYNLGPQLQVYPPAMKETKENNRQSVFAQGTGGATLERVWVKG